MTQIIVPSRRVWTRQPQKLIGIDWTNPLARGLKVAICPTLGMFNVAAARPITATSPINNLATANGLAYSWSRATANPIDTQYLNASLTEHSCFVLVRHPSLSIANDECYIGSRVSSNNGFSFYTTAASGAYPDQLFSLGYVHGGVAAYNSTVTIPGVNTGFIGVGFSAKIGSDVRFFARGKVFDSKTIGSINQSSSTLRIARDVYSANNSANYDTPLMLYWNRKLSDVEQAVLAANPWQIFKPRDRYAFASLGGGGTASVYSDSALSYYIRSLLSSDSGITYAIRNAIYQDDAVGYYLRASVAQNSAIGYVLRSAIAKDATAAYLMRGLVQTDGHEAYSMRGLVQTSDSETYIVRAAVSADTAAVYDVLSSSSVASNSSVIYSVRGSVTANSSPSYAVRSATQSDQVIGYSLRSFVSRDVASAYGVAASESSVYSDLAASYSVDGVTPACPTAESIAAAVVSALQGTTIPVDAHKIAGQSIYGNGRTEEFHT